MRLHFATLLCTLVISAPAAAADSLLGQKVFWRPEAKAKVGTSEIAINTVSFPATVEMVNGDWLWLGRAWVRKQDVATSDQALVACSAQLGREPKNGSLWTCRGAIRRAKGDYQQAIADFTEAIRLDPKQVAAYNNRGSARCHEGQYDAAINDLNEAIRLAPASAPAYVNRGVVWCRLGEYDKALRDLNEAIRLDPKDPEAFRNRGAAFGAKGDYGRAISDFDQAIGLNSTDQFAYADRGSARSNAGDYEGAVKDYGHAIRLDPTDADAFADRGSVWAAEGEYDRAIEDYHEALRLDPKADAAYNNLAWLEATCPEEQYRDGKKAVENATQACELSGWKDFGRLDTLAAACAEAGEFDSALKWQQRAIDLAGEAVKDPCRARLEFYKAGKPYRAEPKK